MSLSQYKYYLLTELYYNGHKDMNKNKDIIEAFLKTTKGQNGLLAFNIQKLKLKKTKKKPELICKSVWPLYESLNPIATQQNNI